MNAYISSGFINKTFQAVYNKIEYGFMLKTIKHYIKKQNESYYINNRRISKLILNISCKIVDELNKLIKQQKNISDLSEYSIMYLLTVIVDNRNHNIANFKNIYDTLIKRYTLDELYSQLSRFNILYTCHYKYKFCMLLVVHEEIRYQNENHGIKPTFITTDYFRNLYLSMKHISYTLYEKYNCYIHNNFYDMYMNLTITNNITNPSFYNLHLPGKLLITDIQNIKNRINKQLYYNILLLYMYKHRSYIYTDTYNQIYNYIQYELTNLISERIQLNDICKLYFLEVSNLNNFILYIMSNNIILSNRLLNNLFYNNEYEFCIIDLGLKIKFLINNNIPIKTKCTIRYIPIHIQHKFIDYVIIDHMTQHHFIHFLDDIKNNKIILTNENIIKLKQFNSDLYMKILHK